MLPENIYKGNFDIVSENILKRYIPDRLFLLGVNKKKRSKVYTHIITLHENNITIKSRNKEYTYSYNDYDEAATEFKKLVNHIQITEEKL